MSVVITVLLFQELTAEPFIENEEQILLKSQYLIEINNNNYDCGYDRKLFSSVIIIRTHPLKINKTCMPVIIK